jgi:hypothetical protein
MTVSWQSVKPGTSNVHPRNTTAWVSMLHPSFSINLKVCFYSSFTWWIQNRSRINLHGRIWTVLIQYPQMTQWCLIQKLPTFQRLLRTVKKTFISRASSVNSTLPQPTLLAPLLNSLSIHISVSVMAEGSKFVCTSCFSHTSYMTFQYNHLDYIWQGIKLSYMKTLELELSAPNTLQKTWNLNGLPLLCMLLADESQHHTVHRYGTKQLSK